MTFSDLISGLALGVSTLSAIGVYLAPLLQERFRWKANNREKHKEEIIKHVLKPLIKRIKLYQDTYISYYRTDAVTIPSGSQIESAVRNVGDFIELPRTPPYVIEEELQEGQLSEWFNYRLYDDYVNHDKELFEFIELNRKVVKNTVKDYLKERLEFTKKLYDKIRPAVESDLKTEDQNLVMHHSVLATKISLLEFLGYSGIDMNSLRNGIKELEFTRDTMNKLGDDDGLLEQMFHILDNEIKIEKELTFLRDTIYLKSTSGKKLVGNCHYLGK